MEVRDEDFENVDPGELRILLPTEGCYPAQFKHRETRLYGQWGEKLIFKWEVFTSIDKTKSISLCRYYNIQRDGGNRLKFGPLHAYRKDWVAANGGKLPLDRSRLSLSIWKEQIFLVEVVTVCHDSRGKPLLPSFYWSKVNRVIRPIDENEQWERLPIQLLNSAY